LPQRRDSADETWSHDLCVNPLNRTILGVIGGIVATGPMTVAMILLHRRLPHAERYPLPPREITMKLARKSGVASELDAPARSAVTIVSHFGYGAASGALYTALFNPRRDPVAKGVLFGLFVWVASYLGWLPATGILSSAMDHPARRNALMIAAHAVWGVVLGSFVDLLAEESEGNEAKPFSAEKAAHHDLA